MLTKNHFQLLNLPLAYAIDTETLDRNYRLLQSEVHPDRFADAGAGDKLRSLQWATQVNDAYRTLKQPLARARYLLQLQGIDAQEESNTAMPADFLMQQLEWREAIEDARNAADAVTLQSLRSELLQEAKQLHKELELGFSPDAQLDVAAGMVRKLSFIERLREDVEQTLAKIEDAE